MKKSNFYLKVFAIAASAFAIVSTLGVGCMSGFLPVGGEQDLGSKGTPVAPPTLTDEPPVTILPTSLTASVVNYEGVFDNMIAQTGVLPSNNTINRFNVRLGMMSETGSVTSVNSSMLLATTTIAGEICGDLVTAEFAIATAANRRIFNSITNVGGTATAQLTDAAMNDIIRRMARSFWQRNEDAIELQMLKTGLAEAITANAATTARQGSLYICTAMLASTSSITL